MAGASFSKPRDVDAWLARAALSPTVALAAVFLFGFAAWTGWISLTASTLLPDGDFVGLLQYRRLFATPRWATAYGNLFVFGALFMAFSVMTGLLLAILLDRRIRGEGALRTIFLYPMAISFVVTGVAWRWILNPSLGVARAAALALRTLASTGSPIPTTPFLRSCWLASGTLQASQWPCYWRHCAGSMTRSPRRR